MSSETYGELLADLAIVVTDDVIGVRIDSDETVDLNVVPSLLSRLPDGSILYAFADLHATARYRPAVGVSPTM